MSNIPVANEMIIDWAGRVAADFLMLDTNDLPSLAHLSKDLDAQAKTCMHTDNTPEMQYIGQELKHAADTLKGLILGDNKDTEGVLKTIEKALEKASDPAKVEIPADGTSPTPEKPKNERPAWVDDTILQAYTDQQLAVLPEIEQSILAFEQSSDPKHIADLKRALHTLKGESGVIGAIEIEQVCHRMEDYLSANGQNLATDTLLFAIDWITSAVKEIAADTEISSPDNVLEMLTPPPPPQETPNAPQPEPQAPNPAPETAPENTPDHTYEGSVPIGDPELAVDFIAEAQEHFDASDQHLMILEKEPDNKDSIAAVFRSFHTIKGVAGFIGLTPICDLAHVAETLLDDIRKDRQTFSGKTVDAIFGALDHLKIMVADLKDALENNQQFPTRPELAQCIQQVARISAGEEPEPAAPPPPVASTPQPQTPADSPAPNAAASVAPVTKTESAQVMKVDAARIDLLLDTIGELVIAEAIVAGDPEIQALQSLRVEKRIALLNKITRSLQDMAMSMRLVPIDPVFRKMARLVRDLCHKSGKQVELLIEGGDTEIDKSMVDRLSDPLVHMVRNSVDHGIEQHDQRRESGKPSVGKLTLRAYHKGGSVKIEIEDDGKGLNKDAIIAKAIERKIIHSGDGMSDEHIFGLIFESGFSTAAKITEISGRGVGMDVVRREIEALRGTIGIRSTAGKGTTFTLSLPLTTAIIDGMLMKIADEIFILPTLSVIESIRPAKGQISVVVGKGEVVSFRDELLPVYRLAKLLEVKDAIENPMDAILVIVEESNRKWAFMVDDLLGQQQVVIKSMGNAIGSVPGITGASILADGKPGLILDAGELVRNADHLLTGI